jgi:hypothetical protein
MNYFTRLIERLGIRSPAKTVAATAPDESPTIAVEPVQAPDEQSQP